MANGNVTGLPLNSNSPGTKLFHPALSSEEIIQAINLAGAAYATSTTELGSTELGNWQPITTDLLMHGLDPGRIQGNLFYQSSSFPSGGLDVIFPGTAEAIVFRNLDSGEIALAFRGTAGGVPFITGDAGDWGPVSQLLHYAAYDDLFDALDAYLVAEGATQVLVSGHSLGGAMVELYMDEYANGTVPGVSYNAVAVASPRASQDGGDARVLNFGHESDVVYSVAGLRGANAVEDMFVTFDDNFFDILDVENQHSIAVSYPYSAEMLLASQFYGETTRDSRVIVSLSTDEEAIREVATDFFFDSPSLILGREVSVEREDGITVGPDDILVGGAGDDFIEGFAGDDIIYGDVVLFGDGGNDTMAGGPGADTFIGTPGQLNNDTIVDLEVGDRIGLSGETVDQDDISFFGNTIRIDADDGFFDLFGSVITINATVPRGASLVVLDETLEDGGSIIEVRPGGQDLAFVIDTTGSMADDIAAVRASANSIINAVFDESRGLTDSRIAIVGYNDPFTQTILSFTDQENIEDRKAAAISAINSISVFGGGDEPELTYAGLLRALNGGAGDWRPDAVSRKIVLFGDASPKDPELRPQVFALAENLGVDVSGFSVASLALPEALSETGTEVSVTTFSVAPTAFSATATTPLASGAATLTPLAAPQPPVSVQIFTIVLGGNPAAVADFELIAEESGGEAFSAAGASQIVEAILEVLNLPNYGIAFGVPILTEGNSTNTDVTVTVSRDVADSASQVALTAGGTADTADYLGTIPATLTFAEGEFSQSFTLSIVGDTRFEGDETLTVSISEIDEPSSVTARTAQLTIVDDDAANSAPVARNDLVEVVGTAPLVIAPLANDSDADGDTLVLVLPGAAGKGTIVLNDDDTLTYASNTGETAIDVFAYSVTDGTETASAQVLVRVVGTFAEEIVGDEGDNVLAAGAGSDRIDGGLGSDFLGGLGGGDILSGGDGNDYLTGGRGDDTIIGGAGNDTMYGGSGTNVFVFGEGDLGAAIGDTDEITAFGVLGTDFLDFSGIDAIAGGEDDAFTFIGEAAFSGTAGELRFERSGANTDIFGDINGDGLADIALRLYGNVALDGSALIA